MGSVVTQVDGRASHHGGGGGGAFDGTGIAALLAATAVLAGRRRAG